MKWIHIYDERPDNNSIIIQIDQPFDLYEGDFKKHYDMGMREYKSYGTWAEALAFWASRGSKPHSFWWMYAKDFPFPTKDSE